MTVRFPVRVGIFQGTIQPYRVGVFETLSRLGRYDYCILHGRDLTGTYPDEKDSATYPFAAAYRPVYRLRLGPWPLPLYVQPAQVAEALARRFDVLVLWADFHVVSHVAAALAAKSTGKKVVLWGHGLSKGAPRTGPVWWARKAMVRLADAVLLYGRREYDHYAAGGMAMEKVFVTHNALDTRPSRRLREEITPDEIERFRRRAGLAGRRVLLYVGRLLRRKRADLAVEAMPGILHRHPDAKLVIVGDGPHRDELERRVRDLNAEAHVEMPGAIFDETLLARYFLAAEAAVCPGPVGLMANHAFAYALPVVTHDDYWAQSPEIAMVQPGVTGHWFREGSAADLAAVLCDLLDEPARRAEMSANCLRLIETEYNEVAMAASFDRAVAFALSGGARRSAA